MSDKLSRIVQWSLYILLGLTALLGILFYTNTGGNTDLVLYWGYLLFFLTIAITLLVSLFGLIRNPKGSIKVLIALALIVVAFIVSYVLSTNPFSSTMLEKMDVTETTVKLVGAGLLLLYVLGLGAIAMIIYTTIARFFK